MRKSQFYTVLSTGIAAVLLILGSIVSADTDVTTGAPVLMGTIIGNVTWDKAWHEYKLYTFLALLIIMIVAWWWLDKDK